MTAPDLDLGVVLLNWNGANDTLACLDSILSQERLPARLVVVDNGSADDSVARLAAWAATHAERLGDRWDLIPAGENLGFAAGNNVGLRLLLERRTPAYVMLLNNDTELVDGALAELVRAMDTETAVQAMVPQIRYWSRPERIWNCGGHWTWYGKPRYAYHDAPVRALEGKGPFEVTCVTGCALIIRTSWMRDHGVLTERFFFGEEDMELSWRMRRTGPRAMLCWPQAVILHKVGTSVKRMAQVSALPQAYSHYLNRLIFLRSIWGRGPRWQVARLGVAAYLALMFRRRLGVRTGDALGIVRDLMKDASSRDGVDAGYFTWIMKERFRAWQGPRAEQARETA